MAQGRGYPESNRFARTVNPSSSGHPHLILLVDNYDSFVFNLGRYLIRLGQDVVVRRNDSVDLFELARQASAVVLSPGPKAPKDAGQCIQLVKELSGQCPILGVCLGHQIIGQAFGGSIVQSSRPYHGRTSMIRLGDSPLWQAISSPTPFARYHSLVVDASKLPSELKQTAWTEDGLLMGLEHRRHPTFGVQFHPESILSQHGYRLIGNFLQIAGLPVSSSLPASDGSVAGTDLEFDLDSQQISDDQIENNTAPASPPPLCIANHQEPPHALESDLIRWPNPFLKDDRPRTEVKASQE